MLYIPNVFDSIRLLILCLFESILLNNFIDIQPIIKRELYSLKSLLICPSFDQLSTYFSTERVTLGLKLG